jgi:hypothetical protein
MKEKDLIEFGFLREDVSSEQSGGDPFFYYIKKIGDIDFISSENDALADGEFYIEFFNHTSIKIYNRIDWKVLSYTLERCLVSS